MWKKKIYDEIKTPRMLQNLETILCMLYNGRKIECTILVISWKKDLVQNFQNFRQSRMVTGLDVT